MKLKKILAIILTVIMVATLVLGCSKKSEDKSADSGDKAADAGDKKADDKKADDKKADDKDADDKAAPAGDVTIKIAHLVPLSGGSASDGEYVANSAQMAADEINDAGGVKLPDGTMALIEYTQVDETSNSAQAIDAAEKAISLDPLVMIGPNRSGGVLAAEQLWKEAKIPTITDGTNPDTTRQGNEYTFRMQISSDFWIPLLITTAVEKYDVKRPTVAYALTDYSKPNWEATEAKFKEYGIDIASVQTFNEGDQDFSAQLLEIKNADPDAIFVYGYPGEVGKIIQQRVELGMADVPIFSDRVAGNPALVELAGGPENFEGTVTSTTFCTGDPANADFVEKYKARFGKDLSGSHLNHYDSIYIIADIVSRVGLDREKVREELANLDYEGTLGHYQADAEGNLVHHMHTQLYKDGNWELLMTEEYPVE
ncbi:MAG TPA: ABC transporter substrate-binding protein [Clostridiaceae bacterium]|nr:ABC transporter substrate-binding protein [Clostridiaceae bacterium]